MPVVLCWVRVRNATSFGQRLPLCCQDTSLACSNALDSDGIYCLKHLHIKLCRASHNLVKLRRRLPISSNYVTQPSGLLHAPPPCHHISGKSDLSCTHSALPFSCLAAQYATHRPSIFDGLSVCLLLVSQLGNDRKLLKLLSDFVVGFLFRPVLV